MEICLWGSFSLGFCESAEALICLVNAANHAPADRPEHCLLSCVPRGCRWEEKIISINLFLKAHVVLLLRAFRVSDEPARTINSGRTLQHLMVQSIFYTHRENTGLVTPSSKTVQVQMTSHVNERTRLFTADGQTFAVSSWSQMMKKKPRVKKDIRLFSIHGLVEEQAASFHHCSLFKVS